MALFGRPRKYALGQPDDTSAGRKLHRTSRSLTAAGQKVQRKDVDGLRRLLQPWQAKAFAYYDLLGEIKFASQFYSRSISNLRLFIGKIGEDGEVEEIEDEPDIMAYLDRIRDPGGGRSNLLASYGRLMFLVGECMLFVSENEDTGEEQWEMLSSDELKTVQGAYVRMKAPSLVGEEFKLADDDEYEPVDGTAVAYRLWRRHPRYSSLADSTMQGVLEICEELVLLTQAVRARARSRLAGSGILFLSEDFGTPPLEPVGDEDPMEDIFLEALTEAMTSPMLDEGTASAVVPLVVRGSTDAIKDGVRHVQVIDPTQLYPETGLREECIKRIAMGLDLPPEILLGVTDSNHWSAWVVQEETWKAHLQPIAQQLVDDLTSAYLRPALKAAGVQNWQEYCIDYDAAEIINHPDRTKDAKDLYDARCIGKSSLREAAGFDDDDAPTEEELNEMLGVAIRDASLAKFGIPAPRGGVIEPQAGELVDGKPGGGTTGAPGSADQKKGPPENATEQPGKEQPTSGNVLGSMNGEALTAKILGAADLAMHRAREQAGNRLRSYAKRDAECLALIDGVRAGQVAPTLGPDRVRALKAPPERQLVEGAAVLLADALRLWGVRDESVAELLGDRIEQHAARTLYEEHPQCLPSSFQHYVTGVRATH